jgi:thioredoxin 1
MVKHCESADEFKALKTGSKPLLVDFTATWCGPCKMIGPYFEELALKFPDVVFVKVDVDELDDVAAACGISAMPTFQLYSNGVMVKEMCGADKAKLEALANEANDL